MCAEYLFDCDFDDQPTWRHQFRQIDDMRLDSPLRPEPFLDSADDGDRCKNHTGIWRELTDFRDVKQRLIRNGYTVSVDFPRLLAKIMIEIFDLAHALANTFDSHAEYQTMVDSAVIVCNRHTVALMDLPKSHNLQKEGSRCTLSLATKGLTVVREVTEWALRRHLDSKFPQQTLTKRGSGSLITLGLDTVEFLASFELGHYKTCCFLVNKAERQFTFLYGDSLRCLVDLVGMRQLVMLAGDLAAILDEPGVPPSQIIARVLYCGDRILREYGNFAYDALKLHESLCIGKLLTMTKEDVITESNTFWQMMERDFRQVVKREFADPYLGCIQSLNNADHLVQIYGLFRLWGHPLVDMIAGLAKMRELGMATKIVDPTAAELVRCQFKESFCESYYRKHHSWPNCITELTLLREGYIQGTENHYEFIKGEKIFRSEVLEAINEFTSIKKNSKFYFLTDWKYVHFEQNFEPETYLNEVGLISDRAASETEPIVASSLKRKRALPRSDNRRVLLSYLRSPGYDIVKFLSIIDKHGLDQDYRIIGLTPKEREMKRVPRLFSLMTYEMRLYITATESLLSHCLLPYLPSITMRHTGSELLRRMVHVTKAMQPNRSTLRVVVNIDFEKWNSQQRDELVRPIFRDIDNLLGYRNLIARTHELFKTSIFYSADDYIIPDSENWREKVTLESWIGHKGGVEGLRQKGWTIVTSAALSYCAREMGIKAEILGSGDNQVLVLEIPVRYGNTSDPIDRAKSEVEAKSRFERFWRFTQDFFSNLGLPIKAMETWFSSSLFAYGKTLFVNGRMAPMSLKRICRMMHATNESYPSYQAQCAGIYAAGEAACETSYTPRLPYTIALYENYVAYRWAKLWTPACPEGLLVWRDREPCILTLKDGEDKVDLDVTRLNIRWLENSILEFMEVNSLFPAIIGGYATQPFVAYMTRGFPDRLTMTVGTIRRYLAANHCYIGSNVEKALKCILFPLKKSSIDWSMLAEDPSSINILRPQQTKNILKAGVLEFLSSGYVNNSVVKALVSLDESERTITCERMSKMTPLLPRFMSTLLDGSPSGIAQSFIHSFEKTNSVQRAARSSLVLPRGSKITRLESDLSNAELNHYLFFLYSCSFGGEDLYDGDYDYAQTLRCFTWGRHDIVGVTVPHPMSYLIAHPITNGRCEGCLSPKQGEISEHLLVLLESSFAKDPEVCTQSRGPTLPYIGSTTRERKTVKSDYTFEVVTNPLRLAMKNVRNAGWIFELDSPVGQDIKKRVAALTNVPIHMIVGECMRSESSPLHRYKDTRLPHGGSPSTLPSPFAWMVLSTGAMGIYSKGHQNHPIHYQQLLSYCQCHAFMSTFMARLEKTAVPGYHYHIYNQRELPPLEEHMLSFIDEAMEVATTWQYTSYPHLKTLFTDISTVRPIIKPIIFGGFTEVDITRLSKSELRSVRTRLHIQTIVRNILTRTARSSGQWIYTRSLDYVWYLRMEPKAIFIAVALNIIACYIEDNNFPMKSVNEAVTMEDLRVYIDHAIRTVHMLPADVFHALGHMYTIDSCRRKMYYEGLITRGVSLYPSSEECNSWAKRSILSILLSLLDGDLSPKWSSFVHYELIGEPVTPREISINMALMVCKVLSLGVSVDVGILRRLRARIYDHTSNPDRSHFLNTKSFLSSVVSILMELPRPIRKIMASAFDIGFIRQSPDLLERTLRSVDPTAIIPICTERRTLLSVHDIRTLNSANVVLLRENLHVKEHDRTIEAAAMLLGNPYQTAPIKPYRHYLKPFPVATTSYYKYIPIVAQYHSQWASSEINLMCLGDGCGGLASVLASVLKPKNIFFNSLVELRESHVDAISDVSAPMLSRDGDYVLLGEELLRNGITDLTDSGYPSAVKSATHGRKFSLITCDAESTKESEYKSKLIVDSVRHICDDLIDDNGIVIMKTYAINKLFVCYAFKTLSSAFIEVSVLRSRFSSARSAEVFLVGKTPHPNRKNIANIRFDGELYHYRSTDQFEVMLNSFEKVFTDNSEITSNDISCSEIIHKCITPTRAISEQVRNWRTLCSDLGCSRNFGTRQVIELLITLSNDIATQFDSEFCPSHKQPREGLRTLTHSKAEQIAQILIAIFIYATHNEVEAWESLSNIDKYWTLINVKRDERWFLTIYPGKEVWYVSRKCFQEITEVLGKQIAVFGILFDWQHSKKAMYIYQLLRLWFIMEQVKPDINDVTMFNKRKSLHRMVECCFNVKLRDSLPTHITQLSNNRLRSFMHI